MKYIRTKDGRIFELQSEELTLPTTIGINTEECEEGVFEGIEVVKQADTIEELITDGDLVMAKDYWELKSKKSHVTIIDPTLLPVSKGTVDELYIKQKNGDWKLVAQKNTLEGELELL